MVRIDIVRRAQIGLRLRAKSHAQLIRAARALFAIRSVDSITVDDVTREAELAKGTFYVHFQHLDDLRAAVADDDAMRITLDICATGLLRERSRDGRGK